MYCPKTAKEHRGQQKARAVAFLGGKCADCRNPDSRVLEFDHAHERRNNGPTIGSLLDGSWSRLVKHLGKCELVCANCHKMRQLSQPKFCVP